MKLILAASSRLAWKVIRMTAQPVPQETVIVGIDGGYVRNWHDKKRNFEVMVGKSMAEGAMTGISASLPARISSPPADLTRFCRGFRGPAL